MRQIARNVILFMVAMSFVASAGLARAQSTDLSGGSFVFFNMPTACPVATTLDCDLDQSSLVKSVEHLKSVGGNFFLLPSATPRQMSQMGSEISAQGGKFLTFEKWEWEAAFVSGQFSCEKYTQDRIIPDLLPLKLKFPNAFYGFQLVDEPATPIHGSLGELKKCLMKQSAFAGMKVFLNAFPVDATADTFNGLYADHMEPQQYGVDCATNSIVDRQLVKGMVDRYTSYVISAIRNVTPDILAFNLYPFRPQYDGCPIARDLLMSENMSIIVSQSLREGITPVAYLQNFSESPLSGPLTSMSAEYANFHRLRWFSGWFFVFGGRDFANFLSHDNYVSGKLSFVGLLDLGGNPNPQLSDQESTFGMTRQVNQALRGYLYKDFVAPFLGVPEGAVIGWMPSDDLMAGEYTNDSSGDVMVYVNRKSIDSNVALTLGLNQWWERIDRLDFNSGVWTTVGRGTNAIDVNLHDFPGALYRLSMKP